MTTESAAVILRPIWCIYVSTFMRCIVDFFLVHYQTYRTIKRDHKLNEILYSIVIFCAYFKCCIHWLLLIVLLLSMVMNRCCFWYHWLLMLLLFLLLWSVVVVDKCWCRHRLYCYCRRHCNSCWCCSCCRSWLVLLLLLSSLIVILNCCRSRFL